MIGVDASVAGKWIFVEKYSEQASSLLREALATGDPIVAPPLLPIEVTNIVRQRIRRERLPLQVAQQRLKTFLAVPVRLLLPAELHGRVLEIADQYGLSAAYDAHYVALAEALNYVLWSDDQRLLTTLGGRLPFVRSIADYPPTAART